MNSQPATEDRRVILLRRKSIFVDWLALFSRLSSEYWGNWHPLLFIPMDLQTEWPRWDHGVHEAMREEGLTIGMHAHGEHVLLTAHDKDVFGRVLLIAGKQATGRGGTRGLIVFGEGDQAQDTVWIKSILSATADLSSDLETFPWKAAIGPFPHHNLGQASTRLSLTEPVRIGGMDIEPLNTCVVDRSFRRQHPSFMSLPHAESWPLSVSGSALGYERFALRETVTRDLVLLCGVLSLASGISWTVRELPFTFGDNEIHMAEDWYGPRQPHEQKGPIAFTPPDWADSAYRFAQENEDYRNALLMFSESLQLEGSHPSITLVAYMSCLQSLGRIIEQRTEKPLKAILTRVRDEKTVKRLLRYYGHRSETAHRAVLWGTEDIGHSSGPRHNPFVQFEEPFWSGLSQVREALIDAFSWVLEHQSDLAQE